MILNRQNRPWRRRSQTIGGSQGSQNRWLVVVLVFLFLGYWLFARYLERIDLAGWMPLWLEPLMGAELPPLLLFMLEMFHWRVLRHFIPLIIGWWLAYEAAATLVMVLYDLPDRSGAKRFLGQLIRAGSSGVRPLPLDAASLERDRNEHVLLRIGGPGTVKVKHSDVAVTEINGRFYRILSSGSHTLHRFEYVHAVLDLRPQERSADEIEVVTRDGIPLTAALRISYRVATGDTPPTREEPFPYDEGAVQTAAYAETVQADGDVATWEALPLGKARGILTAIIANYRLDEILAPTSSSVEPMRVIGNELTRRVRDALLAVGVALIHVQLSRLELPQEVIEQYIKHWQSHSEARIRMSLADGEATALEEMEIARAEAEVTMIKAILEGVQRARSGRSGNGMREVVALRLVEALEKMARQTQQIAALPPNLLSQLDMIRRQLGPGEARKPEPPAEPSQSTSDS